MIAIIVVGLLSSQASASGCLSIPTVEEALKNSKAVFAGRVVGRFKYGVRVKIEKAWKGITTRHIYIYTGNLRNDVDPWFEKGERWLMYAADVRLYKDSYGTVPYSTKVMARGCTRTKLLEYAAEDLKQLGLPKPIGSMNHLRKIKT